MFLSGLIVVSLFLSLAVFTINPMMERVFAIEIEGQLERIAKNLESNNINNEDILNMSLLYDGGITIVNSSGESISFLSDSSENNKHNLYNAILSNIIIEDLKNNTTINEIYNFENGEKVFFIAEKFNINSSTYSIYTYKIIENVGFTKMFGVQSMGFMLLLLIVIYITQLVINITLVRPIKDINKSVYDITNGYYNKIKINSSDELGSLSNSVNILSKKLQEVEILRRELISNISHELRSPLVLIRGYAELVRDVSWQNDEKREEQLTLIINESIRMSSMVDDILDYSQLQAGSITVNKIKYDVIKLIKDEFFIAKKECELCNIKIEFIHNEIKNKYAYVDTLKLSQVFRNLFNNAINHTFNDNKIQLQLLEEDDNLRVVVINTGETIPKEIQHNLFEKYYRVQHQASRKKGTGVGLSIVKAVCELHNFECGVISEDGVTSFYVVIKCIGEDDEKYT